MFTFFKQNPEKNWDECKRATGVTHPQVLADLKNDGLIVNKGGYGKRARYIVNTERTTGPTRDEIGIRLDVYVNRSGEYSFKAVLLGELPTAREGETIKVASRLVKLKVPRPKEWANKRVEVTTIDAE